MLCVEIHRSWKCAAKVREFVNGLKGFLFNSDGWGTGLADEVPSFLGTNCKPEAVANSRKAVNALLHLGLSGGVKRTVIYEQVTQCSLLITLTLVFAWSLRRFKSLLSALHLILIPFSSSLQKASVSIAVNIMLNNVRREHSLAWPRWWRGMPRKSLHYLILGRACNRGIDALHYSDKFITATKLSHYLPYPASITPRDSQCQMPWSSLQILCRVRCSVHDSFPGVVVQRTCTMSTVPHRLSGRWPLFSRCWSRFRTPRSSWLNLLSTSSTRLCRTVSVYLADVYLATDANFSTFSFSSNFPLHETSNTLV